MVVNIKYYVHGKTEDNEAGIATGWLDGKISPRGWTELVALKRITDQENFDLVVCSDLKRALDTANYLFGDRYAINPDNRLRECNYGLFNGRPTQEFKKDMVSHIIEPFAYGESYFNVQERVASLLDYLKEEFPEKRVALIAHQGPQLALDVILKGKTWLKAIAEDWRKTRDWKPGWDYTLI